MYFEEHLSPTTVPIIISEVTSEEARPTIPLGSLRNETVDELTNYSTPTIHALPSSEKSVAHTWATSFALLKVVHNYNWSHKTVVVDSQMYAPGKLVTKDFYLALVLTLRLDLTCADPLSWSDPLMCWPFVLIWPTDVLTLHLELTHSYADFAALTQLKADM